MTSAGDRIVASCHKWLDPGPLGDTLRGREYRELISCGYSPALAGGGDIGKVHTSCAIFVRAILHDAGVLYATGPGHVGAPMMGGWLGELTEQHPAWVRADAGVPPVVGAIFFVQSPSHPNNCHTGILLTETTPNLWDSAEGGGGDGTKCGLNLGSAGRHIGSDFDHWGRVLIGWWDPALIERIHADTDPPPEPVA